MKKILNFGLCMLLALSLSMGNVVATVNAIGINTEETVVADSTTEGAVDNNQGNILPEEETEETQAPEVTKETEETQEPEVTQEAEETREPEVTEEVKKTEEKVELANSSKKTVATQSNVKKSAMQTKMFGINFTIDLDIADEAGTIQTVDGKKVKATEQMVTADIKDLKVTKADGKKVTMFEDKLFANDGLREFYSLGLPFTDKKEMTVRFNYVVTVNGTKYEIPFERTYKGSDEECKAFGYMKINITKAELLEAVTHTVTFVDHDGKALSVNEDVLVGTSAIAPENPERTGYTFTGWSCAYDKITSDLTVKAQYKVNEYNVTFVDYDGTQIGQVQKVEYEKAATAPADPAREGYTFTGWDKAFDKITGDLTVTAEYELNKYKVTFVDYDETIIGEELEVEHGKAATAPEAPTRAGYTFIGWDVDFNEVKSDLTVTAQYEMLPSVLTGTAMFFIVNSDERPKEPASYPSENYTRVGDGIIKLEAVHNDDEKVNENIIEAPLLSIEDGWTVRWYVIKKEADGWHVDGIKEKVDVSTGSAVEPVDPEPKVTSEAAVSATPEVASGVSITSEPAVSATPEVTTGAVVTTGSTASATPKPYIPYIGPFTPQNTATPAPTSPLSPQKPEVSEDTTEAPTSIPTEDPENTSTEIPTTGTDDGKEDTNETDADENRNATATPSANVEIKEDQIPDASPVVSSTPTKEPTVVPTETGEGTATPTVTPATGDGITVQDNELPDSASASDEETDDSGKETDSEDPVELEEDDIANSGVETDEEDTDDEDAVEEEAEDGATDTEEVEEDEIANALPQTGAMSSNVFYFVGSMICALGICILTAIRRKTIK